MRGTSCDLQMTSQADDLRSRMGTLTRLIPSAIAALYFSLWGGSIAQAQNLPSAPPAIRQSVDPLGVDLVSGSLTLSVPEISVGNPSAGGLSLNRVYFNNGWQDNLGGVITAANPKYTVSIEGYSESFTLSGGAYSPQQGQGSTLTFDSATLSYTYTAANGAVAVFLQGYGSPGADLNSYISSLTLPNGVKVTYIYAVAGLCIPQACAEVHRLQSVSNNYGYQIHLDYALNGGSVDSSTVSTWLRRTRATAVNMAVDYCDPNAVTCPTFSETWPRIDYGGTTGVSETITNVLGQVTTYTYDTSARLSSIRAPSSSVDNLDITYDAFGRVATAAAHGLSNTYGYSDSGSTRTTTVTDGLSHTHTVVSDLTTSLVSSEKDGLNRNTSYLYDPQGRRTRVTFPEGNYVATTYDLRGNVTETRVVSKTPGSPADVVSSASFDTACTNRITCNQPNFTRDPRGSQTDYTYSPSHGGVLTVTAPSADVGGVRPQQRYTYTPLQAYYKSSSGSIVASGQSIQILTSLSTCRTLASCTGSADESRSDTTYGTPGVANNLLPTAITTSDGAATVSSIVGLAYDAVRNLVSVDGPLAGSADVTQYRYDALRRRVGVVGPDPDGAGPRHNAATRNTYDSQGRLVTVEIGTVNSQSDADWAAFASAITTTTTYDNSSRPIQHAVSAGGSASSSVQQISYDAASRTDCTVTRMNPSVFASLPASACVLGTQGTQGPDRIVKYVYDAADEVLSVTRAYGTSAATVSQTWTYSSNGRHSTLVDSNGNLTTLEYDGFDRPLRRHYPSATTAGVSSSTDYAELGFDTNSNVISIRTRDNQTISLTRDNLNRLRIKAVPGSSSIYFDYDNQGRGVSERFGSASGAGFTEGYDGLGRHTTHTSFGHTLSYQYDPAGNRTQITHPDGFFANYFYNAAGQLTSIVDSAGTTLASFVYDDLGERTGLGRGSGAGTGYGYDGVGRLASVTQDLSGTGFDDTTTFGYNAANQIVQRTQTNDSYSWQGHSNASRSASYNGLNQETALASTAFGYDLRGNLQTGNEGWTYSYDVENHLTTATSGATTVTLSYDPAGMLNKITPNTSGSTEMLYDGSALVAEYDSAGNVLRRFVHGPAADEPLVWYEGAGTTDRRWLHADERGSAVAISDGSGTGTVQTAYSAYGETDMSVGPPLQYTGQLALPQLNLYYYKARFYAPKLGRFLQPDPAGLAGGLNLYGYTAADPVNRSDPSGLYYNYDDLDMVTVTIAASWEKALDSVTLTDHGTAGTTWDYASLLVPPDYTERVIDQMLRGALANLGPGSQNGSGSGSPQENVAEVVVCSGSGCPGHRRSQGLVSNLMYTLLVHPAFGWIDCAGNRCSSYQEIIALAKPVAMGAGFALAGGVVQGIAITAPQIGASGALSALMALSPDAISGIATALDVEGAEALEQVGLLEAAEDVMSETTADVIRALSSSH